MRVGDPGWHRIARSTLNAFLTTVEASKLTGSDIDTKRASITFRAFAEEHSTAHSPILAADTTRGAA